MLLTIRSEALATFIELETNIKPVNTRNGFQFEILTADSSDAEKQTAEWQMRYAGSGAQRTIETFIANSRAKRALARNKSLLE